MGDLSKNFNREDFLCPCIACHDAGATEIVKPEVISALQAMRDFLGKPLVVVSGVRCASHNAAVGGARDSRHLPQYADAVDVACADSEQTYRIIRAAIVLGNFRFIELAPRHIHFDLRPGETRMITGVSN